MTVTGSLGATGDDTVLAVDVGGTSAKLAVVDREGRILRLEKQPTGLTAG